MPIFDKLKSIFIVPDKTESNQDDSLNPSVPGSVPNSVNSDLSSNPSVIGSSSEKFIELLSQVLEKNNQSGF